MTSTFKKLPQSQVEITITVPYSEYLKAEKAALVDIGKEVKIDGFRPGHIPEAIVREKVSDSTIMGFALEHLIPTTYAAAVKEHDFHVVAQPKIDVKTPVKKEGDELVYVATVAVMPEVKLGDYKKIKVKMEEVKVGQKEIDETIQMLMDRFASWKDVEREAKNADRVELDFEGFDENGEAIPNTASKNHPVVLGSKVMIPGFEEQVVGMKVGEEKEFDIVFPDDYHAKNMEGKKVKFKLKLGRLEEKEQQKLDEEMIEKILGEKQSVEEFKKKIEEDLLAEMRARAQNDVDNKVIAEIIKITEAELPEVLIQEETVLLKNERKQQITSQGLTWEQYLKHVNKSEEEFDLDHKKPATDRLLARLGVNEIIKHEKTEATEAEVEEKIQELIKKYPEDSKKDILDYYKKGSENYRQLKNNLSADKLIKMFIS